MVKEAIRDRRGLLFIRERYSLMRCVSRDVFVFVCVCVCCV